MGFEAAGNDATIEAAVDAARPGARVMLFGIPGTEHSSFPATARRKGVTLVMARLLREVYPRAMALVAAGARQRRPTRTASAQIPGSTLPMPGHPGPSRSTC